MRKRRYKILTKLKGLIREKETTYEKLSKVIGVSSASVLSDKINGFSIFTLEEVVALVKELNIELSQIHEYFF
jgi:hypothetical protein